MSAAGSRGAALFVEHVEGELDRAQGIAPPILFRILLRVRVLDRETVGIRQGKHYEKANRKTSGHHCGEIGVLSCRRRRLADAGDGVDGVPLKIMETGAGSLVGIGDDAAMLQAPLAGRADRAIDTARAARRGSDHAWIVRVERG